MSFVDEIIQVTNEQALVMARRMPLKGIVGISSAQPFMPPIAGRLTTLQTNRRIVPSYGERYLSTALFADLG
jgi:cysteine synthase A